ncbi:hypothetical protein BJ912DRAFT_945316 [Pholiota molesta]|nr:hypothetical protein BJ912DRAFT_945316 [Pholiota molesta]
MASRGLPANHGSSQYSILFTSRWNSPSAQATNVFAARRTLEHSPTSSTSSSSSMRTRGASSLASSRTTLPSEEEEVNSQQLDARYDARAKINNERSPNDVKDAVGFNWDKVTEVAAIFTQEMNKVWATGLHPLVAGDVAADDESELTRVMRAYHLSKARNPSELPNWLFSERERGQLGGLLRAEVPSDDSQSRPPGRQRNLETGEISTPRTPERRLKNIQNFPTPINRLPPTKTSGVDRLKMMREKRSDRL